MDSRLSGEGDEKQRDKGAFTSSYMSRSLNHELKTIGRSFDQLQFMHHEEPNRSDSTMVTYWPAVTFLYNTASENDVDNGCTHAVCLCLSASVH